MSKYIPSTRTETSDPALEIRGGFRLELRNGYQPSLVDDPLKIRKSKEQNSPTAVEILRMYAEHLGLRPEDFKPLLATEFI